MSLSRDFPEYGGRPVTWTPWRTLQVLCLPPRPCPHCKSTAEAATASGTVHPAGPDDPPRHLALIAFRCPDCDHIRILDRTRDFAPVDPHQTTLF